MSLLTVHHFVQQVASVVDARRASSSRSHERRRRLVVIVGVVVFVDVNAVVFAGEYDRAVVHERHVEALGVLDLGLESADDVAVGGVEHGHVEVVVVVGDEQLTVRVHADADRIVGDALAANLAHVLAVVVEDLDAVGAVVAHVDLLALVGAAAAVGKLEVLGAVELVQHVAHEVEHDHAHDLALDHDDAAGRVDAQAARMLQYVGAELAQELTVLVVHLDLVGGRALGDDNVAGVAHHRHPIRVQELALAFAALAELELEATVAVEDLYAMRVGVGHDDVAVDRTDGHAARLGELRLGHAELAELARVDHLGSLELLLLLLLLLLRVARRRRRRCE